MPELPEVETIRRGLEPYVLGRTIDAVEVYRDRAIRRQAGGLNEFTGRLEGRRIVGTGRRGKFLWCSLDDDCYLAIHLGMSGQLRIPEPGQGLSRHTRVAIRLSDALTGNGEVSTLHFDDQRTFGWLWACDGVRTDHGDVPEPAAHIALDLMDSKLNVVELAHALQRRSAPIKKLLLNQEVVSGIGNIYADEMLWAAKVDGNTPAEQISIRKLAKLIRAGQEVMTRAIAAGGTSFDSLYVHVNGESGYFSRSLNVYGREGEPCPRCGRDIVREHFMNRSSYKCSTCQR